MRRADFIRGGGLAGLFWLCSTPDVEAKLSEVPPGRVAVLIPGILAVAWLDGPDNPPVVFAKEGHVNLQDLVNGGPGSIVRFS